MVEPNGLCIACGDTIRELVIRGDFTRLGGHIEFSVLACSKCGLGLTFPQPNLGYYEAAFSNGSDSAEATDFARLLSHDTWSAAMVAQLLEHYRAPTTCTPMFLDVGCNLGAALDAARTKGFDTLGIELSPTACGFAKERHKVFGVALEEAPIASSSLDVVLMSHVLEHMSDPGAALSIVCKLLKPNGILGIRVPNYRGILPRIMGQNWMGWYPSQHYWHFTRNALSTLARNCGNLEEVMASCRGSAEPRSTGLKGFVKSMLARACASLSMGDELYLVVRRIP